MCWFYGFQLNSIFIEVIQICALSSLICASSEIIFCFVVLFFPPLPGPEFAHSIRGAYSSPPSFPFPLRLETKLLLGNKLWPMVNPTKSWPRASKGWGAWITRLSLNFRGIWMVLGIERLIHLTIVNTSLEVELTSVAMKFWSYSIYSFLLSFGPISITLRDITILTSLPIQGANELCLLDIQDSSLLNIEVFLPLKLHTLPLSGNDMMSLGFHRRLSMLRSYGFSPMPICVFS